MGGVPAHLIKKRFSDDVAKRLEATKWWNLPEEKLREIKEYFATPEELIRVLENEEL